MALNPFPSPSIQQTVLAMDAWLDSMRQPGGYGGPVVHWWNDCLAYTGPGLDWRYEGILAGYLNLWQATCEPAWLDKAIRAGEDLVAGQLPSGNFYNSCFELNPNTGGTPHEAAACTGLLRLAAALRQNGDPAGKRYLHVAEKNLLAFYVGRLWDAGAGYFRDDPGVLCFVPNKSATLVEALMLYARLAQAEEVIPRFVVPTLEAILEHQVQAGEHKGAICQNSFGGRKVHKYFPYYVARCIPALVMAYETICDPRYLQAAFDAAGFVLASRYADGSFPQVLYPGRPANRFPQWIAATGDVLRAWAMLEPYGWSGDPEPTRRWLLAGRLPDGSIRTGQGFGAARVPAREHDFRDEVAVTGWVDKAFRYLTACVAQES
ncbi:MAG: hypothetical protein VB089_02565 [Anaerolineaceae bacterium]|jgi:hypothetical protein|nr:hypothetical protein [Anaerolineaceae bacterium]